MELVLDEKYKLVSDDSNIILQEKKVKVSGKNIGEVYYFNVGYYSQIQNALKAYLKYTIRCSEASTAKEIIDLIKDVESKIEKICV